MVSINCVWGINLYTWYEHWTSRCFLKPQRKRLWKQASRGHVSFEVVAPQGTSRSLVYRVFKNPILNLFKIWYWPWKYEPKSVALSSLNLDCVKKFIRQLPRIGPFIWYIFDSFIGKNGCISWAKALHFKPVSGTLYKLTEVVLNCCIWSQKYWY